MREQDRNNNEAKEIDIFLLLAITIKTLHQSNAETKDVEAENVKTEDAI
jgi:hypothetical protein